MQAPLLGDAFRVDIRALLLLTGDSLALALSSTAATATGGACGSGGCHSTAFGASHRAAAAAALGLAAVGGASERPAALAVAGASSLGMAAQRAPPVQPGAGWAVGALGDGGHLILPEGGQAGFHQWHQRIAGVARGLDSLATVCRFCSGIMNR